MKRIALLFSISIGIYSNTLADFPPQYFVKIILLTENNESLHGFISIYDSDIKKSGFDFIAEDLVIHEKELLHILKSSKKPVTFF